MNPPEIYTRCRCHEHGRINCGFCPIHDKICAEGHTKQDNTMTYNIGRNATKRARKGIRKHRKIISPRP